MRGQYSLSWLFNQIEHPAGFEYLGFDINTKFIAEAEEVLSESTMIKKHALINDDEAID
jgi:hypothetical protein